MIVCKNCFTDSELIGYIQSSGKNGDCDVCNSKDIFILELTELLDFFQELLANFSKKETGEPLESKILRNCNLFSSPSNTSIILEEVIKHVKSDFTSIHDLVEYTDEIITNYSYWDKLKENIKWERRFLSDLETIQDFGWDGFFNTQYELKHGVKLFRGRVHHESGMKPYNAEEMMCPEPRIAKGGRANPSGIPYLYLSDNPDTVLYEVRASYLDELSIGVFQLKKELEKIKIVDFTEDTSLFQPGSVNKTIKARLLRGRISRELSKPMRRYDTDIEYIPTQFICEFIRVNTGGSGIRFGSSLHPIGNNIVIFDQSIMECINVTLKKVDSLKLSSIELTE